MTQPTLFDGPVPRERKRGHVPRSSVEAYQRTHAVSRVTEAVSGLQLCDEPMTSAELSDRLYWTVELSHLLYVRRGLSDAHKLGLVEHAGKRICAVAGTLAVTWKVRSR